ncbi:hypothetical protein [Photobacterium kagoshimensis]|uniref:hypothetical protein n=1 Tax=Photobacterium kagoshimensis TaxID=2910242 RepID=UPI003D0D4230
MMKMNDCARPTVVETSLMATWRDKITAELFSPANSPSEEVLFTLEDYLDRKIRIGELNTLSVSRTQQQYLPWVLFPDEPKKRKGLLANYDAWNQIFKLFKNRPDAIAAQTLVEQLQKKSKAVTYDPFSQILADTESLVAPVDNRRWKKLDKDMLSFQSEIGAKGAWARNLLINRAHSLLNCFNAFIDSSKENVNSSLEQTSVDLRNKFWRNYFVKGHVQHVWLVASCNNFTDVSSDNFILRKQENKTQPSMVFRIGNYLILERSNCNGMVIYDMPKDYSQIESHIHSMFTEKPQKHKFSSAGYWQYRIASLLKTSVNYMPRWKDYI